MRRIALAANPNSGSADEEELRAICEILRTHGSLQVIQPGEASELKEQVSQVEADLVVVAGGDGTMNLVANALRARLDEMTLALIPRGTGNDLARTLGLPGEAKEAAVVAVTASEVLLDVWRAKSAHVDQLFLNACMGGFPVEVNKAITANVKRLLGPFAFWFGGAKAATEIERYVVTINGETIAGCLAAGVGNGRTAGGGIEVWPGADPHDGLLDACALSADGVVEAVKLATRVPSGEHLELAGVRSLSADRFEIDATPQLELNVDGELAGLKTPAVFELFANTRFIVPAA